LIVPIFRLVFFGLWLLIKDGGEIRVLAALVGRAERRGPRKRTGLYSGGTNS